MNDITNENIIDSPFCWSGKKTNLLPQLLPYFPQNCDLFIDLFGGTASVLINSPIAYKKCLYNDLFMGGLIRALYQSNYDEIINNCENRINQYNLNKENKDGYYEFKTLILNSDKDKQYFLDVFCLSLFAFNGRLEFNQDGEITSSFGKRNRLKVVKNQLNCFLDKLHNKITEENYIKNYDYKNILEFALKNNKKDLFIYCDVPYSITRINGYKSDYNDCDIIKLLDKLNNQNIKFGMSNVLEHKGKQNKIIIEWSKQYNIHFLDYNYDNNNNSNIEQKSINENNITKEVYICNY